MQKRLHGTILVTCAFSFFSARYSTLTSEDRKHLPISAEVYLQRLQTVPAESLIIEFQDEFLLLLDAQEKSYYESLHLAERRLYIARFWRLRDPDLFTPANERLEEHLLRRDFAREHFGARKPPYFDDRGAIYLRYGRPHDRYVDPGHYLQVNPELSIFVPDFELGAEAAVADSGILQRGVIPTRPLNPRAAAEALLPPGKVMVLENETWSYEHIQTGLVFSFVRQGEDFRLVPDLRKAVSGGRLRYRVLQSAVLYLRRQNVSPAYARLARDLEDVGRRLRSDPGQQQLRTLDTEISVALDRSIFEIEETMRQSPAEAYLSSTTTPELPFVADLAQFRGEQGKTRVVIGMGANWGESEAAFAPAESRQVHVTYSYVLNNRNGEGLAREQRDHVIPISASGAVSVLGSISQLEFSCPVEQYLLALQAAEANGARKSTVKLPLLVRDFNADALMLSDIQFRLQIHGASSPATCQPEAGEAKTIPYPFETVLKSVPLSFYYEIYNPGKADVGGAFRIDCRVSKAKAGKSVFGRIGSLINPPEKLAITLSETIMLPQPVTPQLMSFDLARLQADTYLMEIVVSSLQDSTVSAATEKPFVLVEGQ
ncbi:MAG: GWxTD domain-containing protein [bacterium]